MEPPPFPDPLPDLRPDPLPEDVKQVIVIRRDLHMRRGKEIAQGAHASSAWLASLVASKLAAVGPSAVSVTVTLDPAARVWLTSSFRKVTLQVQSEDQLVSLHEAALARGLHSHLIRDSGRTEFGGVPTITALAIGPGRATDIDELTGGLTLY